MIASLIENKYRNQKVSETNKGSSAKYSATVTQKISRKSWYAIFLKKNFSEPDAFWNREGFLDEISESCEIKKSRQNLDTSYWKKVSEPEVSWDKEGFLYETIL